MADHKRCQSKTMFITYKKLFDKEEIIDFLTEKFEMTPLFIRASNFKTRREKYGKTNILVKLPDKFRKNTSVFVYQDVEPQVKCFDGRSEVAGSAWYYYLQLSNSILLSVRFPDDKMHLFGLYNALYCRGYIKNGCCSLV